MGFLHRAPGAEAPSTKYFLATVAVVFAFLTSGIVFGYSGLVKVFVYDVKAFAEFCDGQPLPCHAQTERLTLMYTIAATTISGCAIFVGMFLDHFGPRITACVGSVIFALGLASLAMAAHLSSLLYYQGYFLLALAGPCIFNSLICFGELFPESSAMIIAALNGAFDSSAVVMFAFGQAVDIFNVPFQLVCLAYLVVPVTIFICSLFLFPDEPFGSGSDSKNKGEIHRVWNLKHTRETMKAKAQGIPVSAEATVPLLDKYGSKPHSDIYNTDFATQLKSGVFWSMTAVTAFLVLRVNFYIATVFDQLLFTAKMQAPNSALVMANSYTALFNYILPFGGVLMVPFVGWSLTDLGLGPSFFLIALLNLTFSVTSTLNWIPIKYQTIAFIAYSANRPYLFGAMSAYLGRLFGFRNFGKLFGIARLAGAISTSLTSTLTTVAKTQFGGDYFWVNVGFDVGGLLLFVFPFYLIHCVFYGFAIRPKDVPLEEEGDEPSPFLA